MSRQDSGTDGSAAAQNSAQARLGEFTDGQRVPTRKQGLHTYHNRSKDLVTVDGPLATYKGYIEGSDPIVGPNGATVVLVTEVVEITDEVPEWAVTPDEKIGRRANFSPQCVETPAS